MRVLPPPASAAPSRKQSGRCRRHASLIVARCMMRSGMLMFEMCKVFFWMAGPEGSQASLSGVASCV